MTPLLLTALCSVAAVLGHQHSSWGQHQQRPACSWRGHSSMFNKMRAPPPTVNDIVPRATPQCRCGCRPRRRPVATLRGFVADIADVQQTGPAVEIPTPPAVFVPSPRSETEVFYNNQLDCDCTSPSHIMTIPKRPLFHFPLLKSTSDSVSSASFSSDTNNNDAISTVYSTSSGAGSSFTFPLDSNRPNDVTHSTSQPQDAPSSHFKQDVSCSMPTITSQDTLSYSQSTEPFHVASHSSFDAPPPRTIDSSATKPFQGIVLSQILPQGDLFPSSQGITTYNSMMPREGTTCSQQQTTRSFVPDPPPQAFYFTSPTPLVSSCPANMFYPVTPALSHTQPSVIFPAPTPSPAPDAPLTFKVEPFQQTSTTTNLVYPESSGSSDTGIHSAPTVSDSFLTYTLPTTSTKDELQDVNRDCSVPLPPKLV